MSKVTVKELNISEDKIKAVIEVCYDLRSAAYVSSVLFTQELTKLVANEFFKRNGDQLIELVDKDKLSNAILLELSRQIISKNLGGSHG